MKRPGSPRTGRYRAPHPRSTILELLPSHEALVREHEGRVWSLCFIALASGVEASELAFIMADLAGEFGRTCVEQGAGQEFVIGSPSTASAAIVIPLDVTGLVTIMTAVLPEDVSLVTTRPPAGMPLLVVDADDEPAVVFLDAPSDVAPCA